MIPIIKIMVLLLNLEAKRLMINNTIDEPTKAAIITEYFPLIWLTATNDPPGMAINNITSATPKLAPELTPSTEGPASGLRKSVCIIRPATPSAAPASIAVIAIGNLD